MLIGLGIKSDKIKCMDQNRKVQNVGTKSAFTPNSNATFVDCKRAIRQLIEGGGKNIIDPCLCTGGIRILP